jgi:fructoselysine-6-P-deglycase FrlB-like protein
VYFVGSGGSWSNMYTGKYLMDRQARMPADLLTSYELVWRDPPRLDGRALVFLASYSGATEDTLAALRHANARGAHTVAIVKRRPSPMAREAAETIDYDSAALYILPLAVVTLFALVLARLTASLRMVEVEAALRAAARAAQILGRAYRGACRAGARFSVPTRSMSSLRDRCVRLRSRVHGEHPRTARSSRAPNCAMGPWRPSSGSDPTWSSCLGPTIPAAC